MSKDDASWLNVFYICFAVIIGYIVFKSIETVGIQTGWAERYDAWWEYMANPSAVILGGFSAYWLRAKPERHEYLLTSIGEVRKVTWPSAEDTRKMTIIVCVVVAIFGALLAVMDLAFAKVISSMLT